MNKVAGGSVPTSFWVIAGVGMIWNAIGGYLYTWSKLDPAAALTQASPAMQDYVANMPVWAHLGWSLGIWGSVAGSVLMLVRSRYAVPAFLVSLVGAIVSYAAQAMAGVFEPALSIFIVLVIAFLWHYSRRSAAQGLLG
ncbi:MAG: hypothetical protein J0L50_13200 [Sphingomonadales bacterium]|nr:hypothetical protein [Sphingomonadales bacterium]